RAGGRLAKRADIDATAPADDEIASTGAKPVELRQRPVVGPNLDRAVGIARRARVVPATERAAAGAQPYFGRLLRQPQGEPQISAMATAAMLAHHRPPTLYRAAGCVGLRRGPAPNSLSR